MTAFFVLTTIISVIANFMLLLSLKVMANWIATKGYPFPTDEELEECQKRVIARMMKGLKK